MRRYGSGSPGAFIASNGRGQPSDYAVAWREESAPSSPRRAPAVWFFDDKLYMAGGKYSVLENGSPHFVYRNDVWALVRADQ